MRFVAGPRQVGKTTLARSFLEQLKMSKAYYNWDLSETRDAFRNDPYFFDWTRCRDKSRRFENYVAVELKGMVERWNDQGIGDYDICFVRTKEGKETDFLVVKDQKPWCLFEAKLKDQTTDNHHLKQAKALGGIPVVQICYDNKILKKAGNKIFRISASRFFNS